MMMENSMKGSSGRPAFKSTLEKTLHSYRNGNHATVYDVRRDPELKNKDVIRDKKKPVFPFVSGAVYRGEWHNDEKSGFGTQTNPGGSKYDGEFQGNVYHGSGTLFVRRGKKRVKQYVGNWAYGKMNGFGTYFYESGEVYKGNWEDNKRSGQGRLEYPNGDYYEGKWLNDLQRGFGTLYLANGNVFEGLFRDGMKDGPGRFFYAATRKVYEGEWVEDDPRCGEYRDPTRDETNFEDDKFREPPIPRESFPLPAIGLLDPQGTLDLAKTETRLLNATLKGMTLTTNGEDYPNNNTHNSSSYSPTHRNTMTAPSSPGVAKDAVSKAKVIFARLERHDDNDPTQPAHTVAFCQLGPIFDALLGENEENGLTDQDMDDILMQLEIDHDTPLSFPEVVEIAACIVTNNAADKTYFK